MAGAGEQAPAELMALTMRPTGLGHGVYKDDIDFSVFSGEWEIGRIYERRGFPDDVRFVWSLYGVVLTRQGWQTRPTRRILAKCQGP